MTGVLYHNPHCSKSRQALALLKEKGVEHKVHEYLKEPIDKEQLKEILSLLSMSAGELIRKSEDIYKELKLSKDDSEEALIDAMVKHPKLIQRPIYVNNGKAAVGRPPENILEIA